MTLEIDHVIVCVPDLDAGEEWLRAEYGLSSHPGGRHHGHGTANRLCPLGPAYLELLTVVDPAEAAASGFGAWAASALERRPWRPAGLSLRCKEIDLLARRHGLEVRDMSRRRPDGRVLRWKVAGLDTTLARGLPFFIQWDSMVHHPGAAAEGQGLIEEVVLTGEVDRVSSWIDGAVGVRAVEGPPGVHSVLIRRGPDRLRLDG